jgi:hypothetical protein
VSSGHELARSGCVLRYLRGSAIEQWRRLYKDLLRGSLKDGGSAKFRNVVVSYKMKGRTPIVCGEANAKNTFGGYGGWQRWIGAGPAGVYMAKQFGRNEFPRL